MEIPNLENFCETFTKDNPKHLKYYLRDRHGRLTGLLLAFKKDDEVCIGWSKCKMKMDRFNKKVGLYIAAQRAFKKRDHKDFPNVVMEAMPIFLDRAKKYFKV